MYVEFTRGVTCLRILWRYRLPRFSSVSDGLSPCLNGSALIDCLPFPSGEYGGWAKILHFLFTPTFPWFPVFSLSLTLSSIHTRVQLLGGQGGRRLCYSCFTWMYPWSHLSSKILMIPAPWVLHHIGWSITLVPHQVTASHFLAGNRNAELNPTPFSHY